MATSLGGTALAEPAYADEGYIVEAVDVAVQHQMADGSTAIDSVGTKLRFTLNWNRITNAEKNTIFARYSVRSSQAFVSPDGTTYTVLVVPNSWRRTYIEDGSGTKRFNCSLQLIEVSV